MLEGLSRCEPARNTRKPPSLGATMRCAGPLPEVDGLDEQPWIHEGTIRSSLPLMFSGPPGAGDRVIHVTASYQACSDSACLVPVSISLSCPAKEVGLILTSGLRVCSEGWIRL